MTAVEPVVFHLPGSMLQNAGKLRPFYGKIGAGLAARGARVDYVQHDREVVPAQIAADDGFHIIDHGRIRHPRVLNAGLGYVRPYYYLDPWGIRAFSSVGAMPFDPAMIDPERARAVQERLHALLITPRKSRYEQPSEVLPVPQGCIAVFLQTEVHRDVGELCFLTMRRMVKALLARDDPRAIVVKPHPQDADLDTLNWLLGKARKDKRLQIMAANIHDMLRACDVAVTINSAVGIEALLHRKPVVLCGQADFHHCAVTLRDRGGMDAAIAQALARDWPYEAFLAWFFGKTLDAEAPDLIETVITRMAAGGFDLARIGLG